MAEGEKIKVLVAMSGGVDSSYTAYILKEQGFDAAGVTMCFGIPDVPDNSNTKCCGASAIEDARAVCSHLDIPHYVLDFSKELRKYVIDDFVSEYMKGRTPNPCVRCNEYLKFGKLLEYAKNLGFDHIATGHYAKIDEIDGEFVLCRPKDTKKDQTYFLYCINKDDLDSIMFPLSDLTKEEVRKCAEDVGLLVASKPQSQDICFVPGNDYREFLIQHGVEDAEGDIVNTEGGLLGKHKGITNYTLGQRDGLGVAVGRPQYVVSIDTRENKVVIGDKKDVLSKGLLANDFNALKNDFPEKAMVQIRYGHKEVPCSFEVMEDKNLKVVFDNPQESVTPGQSVVLYDNGIVLGGGIISESM